MKRIWAGRAKAGRGILILMVGGGGAPLFLDEASGNPRLMHPRGVRFPPQPQERTTRDRSALVLCPFSPLISSS